MENIIQANSNNQRKKIFNSEQLEAIQHIYGPLLILAGAGTGKTTVVVNRIANILEKKIAFPSNILAVTFTNKASNEMKERLLAISPEAKNVNIGTFHSIMLRILRSHISVLNNGINSNFMIIDVSEQLQIIKKIMQEQNIDLKIYSHKLIHSIIMRIKDKGLNNFTINRDDYTIKIVNLLDVIFPIYQNKLQKSNLIDFGDILSHARDILLKDSNILKYYQDKFKFIHIDEYQDTNFIQYELIKLLTNKESYNICCVGDDDQSIYGWRGAELTHILKFQDDFPSAKIVKLEQNYRSSKAILESATGLIQNNKTRYKKSLWTGKSLDNDKIKIISSLNEIDEADLVTHLIQDIKLKENFNYSDCAILLRSSFQTRSFEEQLISKNIPYRIIGSIKFYERAEIKDALAYIRICINPNNDIALERIINKPKRSVGNISLAKIREYASKKDLSLYHAIKRIIFTNEIRSLTTVENIKKFSNLIDFTNQKYQEEKPADVTYFLLKNSGYLDFMSKNGENKIAVDNATENINELVKAISEFNTIDQFIEHITLVTDTQNSENSDFNKVNVMTIHAAKGLEFEAVFLSGWEEGVFPNQRCINEEGTKGLEEERRLAYVAITRAKKYLYITYAQTRRVFADITQSIVSRFIEEIPQTHVAEYTSEDFLGKFTRSNFLSDEKKNPKNLLNSKKSNYNISKNTPQNLIGKKVQHVKFGNGLIVRENDNNLEIVFEKLGLKIIKRDYIKML
ncbi:MAG: UvrD-helicase domain-containing protein [Rickettsia sp.]|nr:UvrD-helicase domain-containing protein [Rickettsia sp.]